MDHNKALVVLSGGQDSVTCLAWALQNFEAGVEAITFNYGQRHDVELTCAQAVCKTFGVTQTLVDMRGFGAMSNSALVSHGDDNGAVSQPHEMNDELPASFVPNRNAMLLTMAHAHAQTRGIGNLVAGMCQTDYSGYPDCRDEFIQSLARSLNLGAARSVEIHTPLMFLTKAQTFDMAEELGALETVVEMSHTCYNGNREVRHDWGYGCGSCPACDVRRKGWEEYKFGKATS